MNNMSEPAYQHWRKMLSGTSPEELLHIAFIAGYEANRAHWDALAQCQMERDVALLRAEKAEHELDEANALIGKAFSPPAPMPSPLHTVNVRELLQALQDLVEASFKIRSTPMREQFDWRLLYQMESQARSLLDRVKQEQP